jgi:hypothetical protein
MSLPSTSEGTKVGKNRKKRRRRGSTPPTPRPAQRRARLGVTTIPSPFAYFSEAGRTAFIDGLVAEAQQRFAADILAYEPLSLLAHLAFYRLVSPDGIEREPPGRRPPLQLEQPLEPRRHPVLGEDALDSRRVTLIPSSFGIALRWQQPQAGWSSERARMRTTTGSGVVFGGVMWTGADP